MTRIDATAPVIARNELFIGAPMETIWNAQSDIWSWTQWRPTVTAAHLDGEPKAGSDFKWEVGGLKSTSTVQERIPTRRIVWTGQAQGIDAGMTEALTK